MKKRLRKVIKNAKGPVYIVADGLKYPANKKAVRAMRFAAFIARRYPR